MKKGIMSDAEIKRLERYAFLKREFLRLTKDGSQKTEVIKTIAKENKVSTATIYKAISTSSNTFLRKYSPRKR